MYASWKLYYYIVCVYTYTIHTHSHIVKDSGPTCKLLVILLKSAHIFHDEYSEFLLLKLFLVAFFALIGNKVLKS